MASLNINIVNLRPGVELGSIWKMPILYPDSVYSMSGRLGYSNKWFIAVYIACETTFRNPNNNVFAGISWIGLILVRDSFWFVN